VYCADNDEKHAENDKRSENWTQEQNRARVRLTRFRDSGNRRMPRTSESANQMGACASHCGGASSGTLDASPCANLWAGAHHGGKAYLISSNFSGSNCDSGIA
jgi:hypothetical protein